MIRVDLGMHWILGTAGGKWMRCQPKSDRVKQPELTDISSAKHFKSYQQQIFPILTSLTDNRAKQMPCDGNPVCVQAKK
jgi:hypothetical protein